MSTYPSLIPAFAMTQALDQILDRLETLIELEDDDGRTALRLVAACHVQDALKALSVASCEIVPDDTAAWDALPADVREAADTWYRALTAKVHRIRSRAEVRV